MSDKIKKGGGGSKGRPPASRDARTPSRNDGPRSGGKPFRKPDGDRKGPPRASGEGRPARSAEGGKPFRAAGDKPFRASGDKPFRAGGDKPFRAGGDKPFRKPDGERSGPSRSGGDGKPFRASGDKPFRPAGDRPSRPAGDKPFRPAGDRPSRPAGDRPFRAAGDRPFAKSGDKPFRAREGGAEDRPFRARRDDARSGGQRRDDGERSFRGRREDGARTVRTAAPPRKDFAERIAKVMARAGLCSRRDAETWIEAGRVSVNGTVLTSPALDVTKRDNIMVDGKLLPTRERTRLFLFHKPRGLVTTARDPEGRMTVFERLPKGLPRVVTIGRLDINTEGLLLLTNDGGLSRMIELPETGWLRRYRVRAFGSITQADLDSLKSGITIDGMNYGPIEAELEREKGDNVWLTLGLREGKNREVKRILEHLGLQVNRLIRISFGPFQLGDLGEGAVEEVRTRVLADQLGQDLAAQANVDFDAPVFVYDEEDDFRPRKREERSFERAGDERQERAGDQRSGRDRGARPGPTGDEGFRSRGPQRDRDDRPARSDRPVRSGQDERGAGRFSKGPARGEPEQAPRPARRHPTEPLRSVWRADDTQAMAPKGKVPRRGADPRLARAENAEKPRKRAADVLDRKGRKVTVERVPHDPASDIRREPARQRSEDAPKRSLWTDDSANELKRSPRSSEDRAPRGARPAGGRGFGKPSGDRPRGDRPSGDRPRGDRPRGDRPSGDRPRGDRPSGGKPRGPGGARPPRPPRER